MKTTEKLRAMRALESENKARIAAYQARKREADRAEALERMRASTAPTITPAEAAKVMGCHPHTIRVMARENPENLGFPVSVIGSRTIIPRLPFIRYIEKGHSDRGKEGIA